MLPLATRELVCYPCTRQFWYVQAWASGLASTKDVCPLIAAYMSRSFDYCFAIICKWRMGHLNTSSICQQRWLNVHIESGISKMISLVFRVRQDWILTIDQMLNISLFEWLPWPSTVFPSGNPSLFFSLHVRVKIMKATARRIMSFKSWSGKRSEHKPPISRSWKDSSPKVEIWSRSWLPSSFPSLRSPCVSRCHRPVSPLIKT